MFSPTVSLLKWGIYKPPLAAWESACGVACLPVGEGEPGVCVDQTARKSAVREGSRAEVGSLSVAMRLPLILTVIDVVPCAR